MEPSLPEIMAGCRKGDQLMQKRLYSLFYESMMKIGIRYTGDVERAATIYNDAMLKIFNAIHQYKEDGKATAWIKKVVVNTAVDHIRIKSNAAFSETRELDEIENIPIDENIFSKFSAEDIRDIILGLPEKPAIVFNLYVYEEYNHNEIGKMLNITPGTCRYYLSEARRLLREKLQNPIFSLNKTTY